MSERRLLLVDAANVIYRAYFAITHLSTKDGRPTNAVFGFIRMLRQWERLWKPSHWAVVFDGGVPQARLQLLETYKANRAPMPEPLREQFPAVERYLDAAGVARVRVEGEEADDVLAALVVRLAPEVAEALIVTSDKDLFQLVDGKVGVIAPAHAEARIGAEEVLRRTGVSPSRVVEWLALTGDSVDNVPGVPGLGAKTAAKLLAGCGSLAELLAEPARIPSEKMRQTLLAHKGQILRNLEIVRLRDRVPVPISMDSLVVRAPDPATLLPFLDEMEFYSMAEDLRAPSLF